EPGVEHDVPRHAHGVLQVPLNLVQDVLRRAPEEDRAGLWILALREEREVPVSNLLNLKQSALGPHVRLLEVLDPVDDGGARGAGYAVVVGLADAANGRDVPIQQEVLGKIWRRSAARNRPAPDPATATYPRCPSP